MFTKVHVKGQAQKPKSLKTTCIYIAVIQQIINKLHWIQNFLFNQPLSYTFYYYNKDRYHDFGRNEDVIFLINGVFDDNNMAIQIMIIQETVT